MNICKYCENSTQQKVCMEKSCRNKYKKEHYHANIDHYRVIKRAEELRNRDKRKSSEKLSRYKRYYSSNINSVISLMFQNTRSRAKQYKLEFNLDKEFLLTLFQIQSNKCALTGISFEYDIANNSGTHKRPFAPSLDRIDCQSGYTKNNVRLVCIIVNFALCEFGDVAFDKMCKAYVNKKE